MSNQLTRTVGNKWEMNTRIGNQVGLELGEIHVEGTIKSQRSSDRRNNLPNHTVQVGVGGALDVKVFVTNVKDSFIVDHKSTVRVFQGVVCGENTVVWLNDSGGHHGCRVNGKFQLGFLAIIDRETFHEKTGEATARTTAKRVED